MKVNITTKKMIQARTPKRVERASPRKSQQVLNYHVDIDFVKQQINDTALFYGVPAIIVELAFDYIASFANDRRHRGEEQAINKYKALRNYAKLYILGCTPDPLPFLKSKAGFPSLLVPLKGQLENEDPGILR